MTQQLIEQGPGHHHPEVGQNGVDPERLSPRDFYWWSIEQAGGRLEDAVSSVGSSEDALKLAVGMRQEHVATAKRNHCSNTGRAIGSKIEEALVSAMQPGDEYTAEHAEKNDIWLTALNEFDGTTAEISSSYEDILRELDRNIEGTAEARSYIGQLLEKMEEQTRERFSLDDNKVKDLNLVADGYTLREHAAELEVDDTASARRHVSKRRSRAGKALRADSVPHAVRLGIEYGVIDYEVPTDDKPGVEIDSFDRDILELYSKGLYAQAIADKKETGQDFVDSRLSQMVIDFSAKNRQHLVKRAFEEGVLKPDEDSVPHQLKGGLRLISRAEQELMSARSYIVGLNESAQDYETASSSETTGEQEDITPENVPGRYPTIEYILGEQSETADKITDEVFNLHAKVYASMTPVLSPLSSREQDEAELASEGVRIIDRTDDIIARLGITAQRMSMLEKLGTKSAAYAVRIMIESGMLPVQWTHPKEQIKITDPLKLKMLEFASRGGSDPDEFDSTSGISRHLGYSGRGLTKFVRQLKDELSAEDWASLVRRGFEEGLILPDGPLGGLQNTQQHTEKAKRDIDSAGKMLSKLDADEIINYLFPEELTKLEIQELQRMAKGVSARAGARGETTYGAVRNRRESARSKLGAKNSIHAVAIAVREGKIKVSAERKNGSEPGVDLDDETIEVFAELAKGTHAQDIGYKKGLPRPTMYSRLRKARQELSANDNAHAVAILIERGVLS